MTVPQTTLSLRACALYAMVMGGSVYLVICQAPIMMAAIIGAG